VGVDLIHHVDLKSYITTVEHKVYKGALNRYTFYPDSLISCVGFYDEELEADVFYEYKYIKVHERGFEVYDEDDEMVYNGKYNLRHIDDYDEIIYNLKNIP
jgi:hypothetical protein